MSAIRPTLISGHLRTSPIDLSNIWANLSDSLIFFLFLLDSPWWLPYCLPGESERVEPVGPSLQETMLSWLCGYRPEVLKPPVPQLPEQFLLVWMPVYRSYRPGPHQSVVRHPQNPLRVLDSPHARGPQPVHQKVSNGLVPYLIGPPPVPVLLLEDVVPLVFRQPPEVRTRLSIAVHAPERGYGDARHGASSPVIGLVAPSALPFPDNGNKFLVICHNTFPFPYKYP